MATKTSITNLSSGRQFILTLPTDAAGENAAADAMHKAEIAAVNFILILIELKYDDGFVAG